MSLFDAADRLASTDRSQIVLNADRCLHSQDRSARCEACFTVCPVDAILPGKPPVLNVEACQSCLACIPVCPTGAYSADDAVTPLLNCVTRVEGRSIELICEQHPNASTGTPDSHAIRIKGCLAGLGSGAYAMLSALDTEKIIVRVDTCEGCPWNKLHETIIRQVSQARMLLGLWEKENELICSFETSDPVQRPIWEAANPPLSRRDLFRMVARQGQVTMARAMEDRAKKAGKFPGKDRRRIIAAVEHLPKITSDQAKPLQTFGFTNLTISNACTACGACAQACPTQAIKFEQSEEGDRFDLLFDPRDCVGCSVCEHVCFPEAIKLDHEPVFDDIFDVDPSISIHSGNLVRCPRCKSLMAEREGTKLCSLCEERQKNPFGSLLPPGMKIRKPEPTGEKPNDH